MTLIAHEVAIEMIREIKPLIDAIGRHDPALAKQLRRSASSVPLNIGEGARSRGGNELARFADAAGSNNETRSALRVASAWGYIEEEARLRVDAKLDRLGGLLWGLTHRHR